MIYEHMGKGFACHCKSDNYANNFCIIFGALGDFLTRKFAAHLRVEEFIAEFKCLRIIVSEAFLINFDWVI